MADDKHDAHCVHAASSFNRAAIETGKICGCFHCVKVFNPTQVKIKEWIDYQRTALCPFCRIDSIISTADFEKAANVGFLKLMEAKWFGETVEMKNITPENMRCTFGGCPAVYELDNDTVLIIGQKADDAALQKLLDNGYTLPAEGENAIVVKEALLANVLESCDGDVDSGGETK